MQFQLKFLIALQVTKIIVANVTKIIVANIVLFVISNRREKLSKKQLTRKLGLCREVLTVSEIVEAGIATKIGELKHNVISVHQTLM